jgi:single-strand DNA-binding protein
MIIGNLTRDPESRTTPTGQTVTTFTVATNRVWKDAQGQKQENSEYHPIVAWGKLAEICAQYLKKGRKVYIEGRLQTREWDSQDGTRKRRTEIVAENMIILDRGGESGAENLGEGKLGEPEAVPDEEIKVENIPF